MKAVPLNTKQILAFIFFAVTFSCTKEYSFEKHIAKGTLRDSTGECFSATVFGTFYNGIVPDGDTSYIEVKVNVTTSGSYSVYTDVQNGIMFLDSGIFINKGINAIRLKPKGIPLVAAPTHFTILFDTSICDVTINIRDSSAIRQQQASDSLPLNNWRFTDTKRGITYRGLFQVNYILGLGSLEVLVLSTKEAENENDSTLMINHSLSRGIIETGTYTSDDAPNGMVFKTISDA
jgi:hypothetical protein